MKNLQVIFATIIILLAFTNCGGKELCRSELTEPQRQLIPYEKGAVYSFINSEGQVVDLTVTESKLDWLQLSIGSYKGDYASSEVKTVVLQSETADFEIKLQIFSSDCARNGKYSYLLILINKSSNFSLFANVEGNWDGGKWDGARYAVPISFYDKWEINKKLYYDVVQQITNSGKEQLFYNKTYGILQINSDGKNFLTLIPDQGKTLSAAPKNEVSVDTDPDIQLYGEAGNMGDNQEILKSLESASAISVIPPVDFTVYPNPNDGNFTVKVSGDVQPFTLEIFNDKGRLIETIRGKNEVININETKFVQGAYFVRIYMGGKTAVRKIVVQ